MNLGKLLNKHSIIGVAGNRSSGKSMMILAQLIQLKKDYPSTPIYVYGVEEQAKPLLEKMGLIIMLSHNDILDLQIENSVIFVDEIAGILDTRAKNKTQDKFSYVMDRIEHLGCKLIFGTAREGYWNKFACSRITAFLVKEMEYDSLVNNSWFKNHVLAINSMSSYRLECAVDRFYMVSNKGELAKKFVSPYIKELDFKRDVPMFGKTKDEEKCLKKSGKKVLHFGEK